MSNHGNYYPQQGSVPNGSGPGMVNGPGPGSYPQQSPYNPYYPPQSGSYYPQQPMPDSYPPPPYSVPAQRPPQVQVTVQPAAVAPAVIVHQAKVDYSEPYINTFV